MFMRTALPRRTVRLLVPLALLPLGACTSETVPAPTDAEQIVAVPQTETWALTGLTAPAQVVRTEAGVPHIYAGSREDLALVHGFVVARDRFFMMDLSRRLGLGTLSELLGDAALPSDQEARGVAMAYVADRIATGLTPQMARIFDAYAAGINEYIRLVGEGQLDAPSEIKLAQGMLGATSPLDLMKPFDRRAVAATLAVILYQSSYETGDVGRAATATKLPGLFEGAPLGELRRRGAIEDLWRHIEPVFPVSSAAGFGLETGTGAKSAPLGAGTAQPAGSARAGSAAGGGGDAAHRRVPPALLERLAERLERFEHRLGRDGDAGFGSNAWAVSGAATADGSGLIAGDGHLSLSVPSILYQIGLDTTVLGGGELHQIGLLIPGMPLLAIGTNGWVGWSQTQLMGDITDWYAEELRLDEQGRPAESLSQAVWYPLDAVEETYVVADVPALESKGRTESWPRYVTFDGRWLAAVEGRPAAPDEPLGPGEALVNVQGDYVVPGDADGDGVVSAVSFDYVALDTSGLAASVDRLGQARDVQGFREATKGLLAYSQNFAVADQHGDILYSAYQPVPCRGYLEREKGGAWAEGADPSLLLDGTRYRGFRIPTRHGTVDESRGESDPYACIVPFEVIPQALSPDRRYVVTANNDPGNIATDGSLTDDEWYIGGPWDIGIRADTISRELQDAIANGDATIERMAAIQGNHDSRLGELFAGRMLEAIAAARALAEKGGSLSAADKRLVQIYEGEAAAMDEVEKRLAAWEQAGFQARSGVVTFYDEGAEQDADDAVATTLYNAWLGHLMRAVFDDEGLPGVWHPGGTDGRVRALNRFLDGRGPGNPLGLASWNPETGESAFFDMLPTEPVETSREVILAALRDALAFLRSAPTAPGEGGFGTSDVSGWRWGLRHVVRFQSLLADFLGENPKYAALTDQFAITTASLPLAADLAPADPRAELKWFPRPGDQDAVDAGNPGLSGTSFSYGSGPVMRMVVALKDGRVSGRNIIPGGQSALVDSPYFADQVMLWLGNETLPLRFAVADVVAGAAGRESYVPR
ncbi:MAG: penicillin acylase family protein [Deltaproteobacteria bacterium]|nr:penicillin acylase family protein [Deltaproteobacteria bacterium]